MDGVRGGVKVGRELRKGNRKPKLRKSPFLKREDRVRPYTDIG